MGSNAALIGFEFEEKLLSRTQLFQGLDHQESGVLVKRVTIFREFPLYQGGRPKVSQKVS